MSPDMRPTAYRRSGTGARDAPPICHLSSCMALDPSGLLCSVPSPVARRSSVPDVLQAAAKVGPLQPAVTAVMRGKELRPRVQALSVIDQKGSTRRQPDSVGEG